MVGYWQESLSPRLKKLFRVVLTAVSSPPQVLRLKALTCSKDPSWAADVLRAASPLLEELQLLEPTDEHVGLAHAMPRLKRLFVEGFTPSTGAAAAYVRALPALEDKCRLDTFSMGRGVPLPFPLLKALLRAHGSSLRFLQLRSDAHAYCESRFDTWIAQCNLRGLRELYIEDCFIKSNLQPHERSIVASGLKTCLPNVKVVWVTLNSTGLGCLNF